MTGLGGGVPDHPRLLLNRSEILFLKDHSGHPLYAESFDLVEDAAADADGPRIFKDYTFNDIDDLYSSDKLGSDSEEISELADQYSAALTEQGLEVLVDDRDESPGRKFNDADLIGIPIRITIGKRNLVDGKVEIKAREDSEAQLIAKDQVPKKIQEILRSECAVS